MKQIAMMMSCMLFTKFAFNIVKYKLTFQMNLLIKSKLHRARFGNMDCIQYIFDV